MGLIEDLFGKKRSSSKGRKKSSKKKASSKGRKKTASKKKKASSKGRKKTASKKKKASSKGRKKTASKKKKASSKGRKKTASKKKKASSKGRTRKGGYKEWPITETALFEHGKGMFAFEKFLRSQPKLYDLFDDEGIKTIVDSTFRSVLSIPSRRPLYADKYDEVTQRWILGFRSKATHDDITGLYGATPLGDPENPVIESKIETISKYRNEVTHDINDITKHIQDELFNYGYGKDAFILFLKASYEELFEYYDDINIKYLIDRGFSKIMQSTISDKQKKYIEAAMQNNIIGVVAETPSDNIHNTVLSADIETIKKVREELIREGKIPKPIDLYALYYDE